MSDFAPTVRQLLLLSTIAAHIAITVDRLQTDNLVTNLARSIDLIDLAKKGLIVYHGERIVRCTTLGRAWVYGHENWRDGARLTPGGGH
jgi:hypothetical protein